ncbi:hypothetical protein U7230_10240 [Carboxydochorda subterranea]|uniref:Uncharacterized protein n=1 Tax=Carboxydichorda subterranea TaxID=3109565 RepID=A0ABZ1BUM5_9FIRM|nr:hypothetical protein [Limnochorda sp. L945t]WRP16474.1 hypothetical protein U7230_10240 [Limnochorda sp. L945t]
MKHHEVPDKVWLPWVREGPYLVRRQHLVARDEGLVSVCPVPVGQQIRGLCKATLEELADALSRDVWETARKLARTLVEGRPYRLIERDHQRARRDLATLHEALMALCRAGLVQVYCRNRRRAETRWEVRHVDLTNWGRAVLIALEAVPIPGMDHKTGAPGSRNGHHARVSRAGGTRPVT